MNETIGVTVGEFSKRVSHYINIARYGDTTIILTSHGKPKAAIISYDRYRALADSYAGSVGSVSRAGNAPHPDLNPRRRDT